MKIVSKTGESRKGPVDFISLGLFLIVAVFTAYVMIMNVQGKPVTVFGYSVLKVMTGSMEPTIATGEYIIVKDTDAGDLKVGDIITYYTEDPEIKDFLVTHRVVRLNDDGTLITMGDANPVEDQIPVKPERVLGKFAKKARFFGIVDGFGDKRKLLFVLVIVPILVMAVYELRTLTKLWKKYYVDEKDEETEKNDIPDTEAEIERIKAQAIEEYLKNRKENDNGEGQEGQEKQEEQ